MGVEEMVVMVEEMVVMVEEMVVMVEEMVVSAEEMVVSVEEVAVEAAGVEVVITATKMGTWPEIVQSLTVGIVNEILQMFRPCLLVTPTKLFEYGELLVIEALINLYAV